MPSRSQNGRVMNESFDQQAGQSPSPSTGFAAGRAQPR